MGDYISADIVNGQANTGKTETYQKENTVGTTSLGKDAFLQLLVAQLQYQDPLNPQTNQEFVAELAQFSTLEEMQNMTGSMNNSQALSLVGKNVIIEVGKSKDLGNTTTVAGYVDYVQMVDGKAKLSINEQLYDYEDLDMVIDDYYLAGVTGGVNNGTSGTTGNEDNNQEETENTTGTEEV